ncbi:MAG: phage tail protein [Chitinophagaceae bacterium]|nr:MAG: phage tail protein [Chitinophagaceae bacterium]
MEGVIATILLFAGNFAPRGWAFCNGQILSIAQNTALFALLGTTYGGNGQTTFALPDLRGRTPVGTGQGPGLSNIDLGELAGTETVTLLMNNMPMHNHTVTVNPRAVTEAGDTSIPTNAYLANSGALDKEFKATGTFVNMGAAEATSGIAGGSQPFGIRNPYLGMNYIICLEGIFPSRN